MLKVARRAVGVVVLGVLIAAAPGRGQERDVGQRLEAVLVDHQASYLVALGTRSARSPCEFVGGNCAPNHLDADMFRRLVGSGLPASAILLYNYEPPTLESFLLISPRRGRQELHYDRAVVSQEALAAAANGVRRALGVDTLSSDRGLLRSRERPGAESVRDRPPLDSAVARLSELVLPPGLADRLAGVARLVVVPVGPLATLPFALLRPANGDGWLIDYLPVSVAPSLQDLVDGVQRTIMRDDESRYWRLDALRPLVIGNPSYNAKLPQLPGAAREAQQVAGLLGATAVTGPEATAQLVRRQAPGADLLYFATHGAADPESPLDGGLLYMADAEALTAREVQAMDLRAAELVVLSACQTGLGATHDTGVLGLARAFILAGADHVVMSLWDVDDEATMTLMGRFMTMATVRGSESFPAEALRQAILETRSAYPDPAKWAAFVHFGVPLR